MKHNSNPFSRGLFSLILSITTRATLTYIIATGSDCNESNGGVEATVVDYDVLDLFHSFSSGDAIEICMDLGWSNKSQEDCETRVEIHFE